MSVGKAIKYSRQAGELWCILKSDSAQVWQSDKIIMAHQGPDADRGVIISMMALLGKTDSLQISVNYINAQKVQDTSQVIQIF